MKKIKRNQICPLCDSGKKYKKCCLVKPKSHNGKFLTIEGLNNTIRTIRGVSNEAYDLATREIYNSDIKSEDFFDATKIDRIKRNENIPNEIKDKVEQLIKNQPLRRGGCHPNSYQIAKNIEGVKKVVGFYAESFDDSSLSGIPIRNALFYDRKEDKVNCIYPNQNFEKIADGVFVLEVKGNSETIIDFNNKVMIMQHSWNSYKGVHFDLTKNLGGSYLRDCFMDYYIVREAEAKPLNAELTQSILDSELKVPTDKKLINKKQIGSIHTDLPKETIDELVKRSAA